MARFLLIALFLSGCFFKTSDDVPFGAHTDLSSETFSDMGSDVAPLFEPSEVPTGMLCEHAFTAGALCDPVLQNCGSGQYCDLAFDTEVERARAVCKPIPNESLTGTQGETCLNGMCEVGFLCVSQICRRFCELDSGFGCQADEFCDDPFTGTHGVCSATCR